MRPEVRGTVSSPAATGGAGTRFEEHVGAYWLAQLLVQGVCPIFVDRHVSEVHLQAEILGWHTDDFLITTVGGDSTAGKLAGQVKRTFTVSKADADCRKAILDFWQDFNAAERFTAGRDRLVLVVQRGSDTLLGDFRSLLDCALASRTAAEFQVRLDTKGFISNRAVTYCRTIREIIGEHENRELSPADIWPFLCALYVLNLDLATATASQEAVVKTMLGIASNGAGDADAAWNELLALAGQGMAGARGFSYADLPQSLRSSHHSLENSQKRMIRALVEHTAPVLGGIRSTIGGELHLPRAALVQAAIDGLQSRQIVLLTGSAGNGKSAVAKDALSQLTANYLTFGLRAEELAQPHLDGTLSSAGIPANSVGLQGGLAAQDQKVVLIDSIERLLESSTRQAFLDLLRLASADMGLQILLTCRDYAVDGVRALIHEGTGLPHLVVEVPPLSDEEMSEVESCVPALAAPLASPALRRLLRRPYFLDKALQVSWPGDQELPGTERDLRRLFWRKVVRADQYGAGGMPQRRETVFEEIALRRARELSRYVPLADMDPEAARSLCADSLLTSPAVSSSLVAPAHDVLEDWAVIQWIEKQHAQGLSFHELAIAIGPYPALRRAYRMWIQELVQSEPEAGDRLFAAAVLGSGVPAHFRDDTLVSLLRSPEAEALLERNAGQLLANENELFRRVIRLLRVACVTAPAWLAAPEKAVSLFNVPVGPAWGAVLSMANRHRESFAEQDRLLLLDLIEDWVRGVDPSCPCPEGATPAAAIAHWLLPNYSTYWPDSTSRRIMAVIAKLPLAARSEFEALLRDPRAEFFRKLVYSGVDGAVAGRDVPELVTAVALQYFLAGNNTAQRADYPGITDLEDYFGLSSPTHFDYFPASAYRGPWIHLLRAHPDKGIAFFLELFNRCGNAYRQSLADRRPVPLVETELRFQDGRTCRQWGDAQLWCMYRGTSSGPQMLGSLLMAFERWLLEYADAFPAKLDEMLVGILHGSENTMLTAVVASVATARPENSEEALLALLSSQDCVQWDKHRLVVEIHAPSVPGAADHLVYESERKQADSLPHRKQDLEHAIFALQFTPLAARVQEILDHHRASLPPVSRQEENDRVWRIALHRMDRRQMTATRVQVPAQAAVAGGAPAASENFIRFDPKPLDPDLNQMRVAAAARFQAVAELLNLQMWANRELRREADGPSTEVPWREHLSAARQAGAEHAPGQEPLEPGAGAPGLVAAVCIRDHWVEMDSEEQAWCFDRICSEVLATADDWSDSAREQHFSLGPDRSCASVLPLLLARGCAAGAKNQVEAAFVAAITHPVEEVALHACWGVAEYLWSLDPDLAIRCVNAIATQAGKVQNEGAAWLARPFHERGRMEIEAVMATSATELREVFWHPGGIASSAYDDLGVGDWFGAAAHTKILAILSGAPEDPLAVAAHRRAASALVQWWGDDEERRRGGGNDNQSARSAISELLARFALRASATSAAAVLEPILDSVDAHPREVSSFVRLLIAAVDGQGGKVKFWEIWGLFADRVRRATWLARLADGGEMVSAVFLSAPWREGLRHWASLDGYAHLLDALFEDLPLSRSVINSYVEFLYKIGEKSLPGAFIPLANRLRTGDLNMLLGSTNTVLMIETLLLRHVYRKPLELKQDASLRESVLALLDMLVDFGSSAAFRMRDDFVTPAQAG